MSKLTTTPPSANRRRNILAGLGLLSLLAIAGQGVRIFHFSQELATANSLLALRTAGKCQGLLSLQRICRREEQKAVRTAPSLFAGNTSGRPAVIAPMLCDYKLEDGRWVYGRPEGEDTAALGGKVEVCRPTDRDESSVVTARQRILIRHEEASMKERSGHGASDVHRVACDVLFYISVGQSACQGRG